MSKVLQIKTGFVKVATEGNTVDGRNLTAEDLNDMAETYSLNMYEANMWRDHERYWETYGRVIEVKAEKDDEGRVALYCNLNPNADYISLNQRGMANYFSIEINRTLMESGKPYLSGLGVLSEPASQGLQALQLYAKQRNVKHEFSDEGVEIESKFKKALLKDEDNTETSLISKIENIVKEQFAKFSPNTQSEKNQPPEEQDEPMTKEQLDAMNAKFGSLETAITGIAPAMVAALSETFGKLTPAPKEGDDVEVEGVVKDGDEVVTQESFNAMKEQSEKVSELEENFNKLKTEFEKATGEEYGKTQVEEENTQERAKRF